MKVVTYARVSTLGQEKRGQSLPNQERSFKKWLDATGHDRVHRYREHGSAGSIEGRDEFVRMIEDLPRTKPQAVVVETLDRFTRNLRDGLNLLELLRGHGVWLWPLDWDRKIDVDDDRDWDEVVEEFRAAERERRRIRKRVLRSYQGRRERGATTANVAPFGLIRQGDLLVTDPTRAWIAAEIDKRALAGEPFSQIVAWALSVDERAWRTKPGLTRALKNEAYVRAGIRTPETQRKLNALLESRRGRFGMVRDKDHEFTGVFACGACVDAGYPVEKSLMSGVDRRGFPNIQCRHRDNRGGYQRQAEGVRHSFMVAESKVAAEWERMIYALASPAGLAAWTERGAGNSAERERKLLRRLAEIDQRKAALKRRRDQAFDLLEDSEPAVKAQARKLLTEIEGDEIELSLQREQVQVELSREPATGRDAKRLAEALAEFGARYKQEPVRSRNALNRALCAAIGSHPRVYRIGPANRWSEISVVWPEIDALRVSSSSVARAPKRARSRGGSPKESGAGARR